MNRSIVLTAVTLLLAAVLAGPTLAQFAQQRGPRQLKREPFVSVVDFGANGHDNRWDSDAIQAAIDSLPRPSMPGGREPAGGVVALPAGRYALNKPLRIFSGVTLRGEGAGTVLHMTTDEPAILLVSPFGHRYVASAVVEDLTIYTDRGDAIAADPAVSNIVQCRFENLLISPGGCAIDLNPGLANKTYTQNTLVRNIHVSRFGGPALRLWGNANHIEQVNTEGGTREGFKAEPAILSVAGTWNDIRSCIIEANKPNAAVAYHVTGSFTWSHNWAELDPAADGVAFHFEDVETAQIDFLHHLVPHHKAKFVNCAMIQIRSLNLNGTMASLAQNIDLDEKSNLRIDLVIARTDAGMLDDPRVSIGSVFNKIGQHRTDLPLSQPAAKLIPDRPAPALSDAGDWTARWDTPKGRIEGSIRLEDAPDGSHRRLRVEITDNPGNHPLAVQTRVDVPAEMIGRRGIIAWRVEGPGQVVAVYAGQQVPSRAMGSRTANPIPDQLKDGQVLEFVIPPEPGVYYISDVSIHPR